MGCGCTKNKVKSTGVKSATGNIRIKGKVYKPRVRKTR